VVVSEEDMHDLTLNFVFTNLGWKYDDSEPVTIKAKPVKEVIGRSTHAVNLSVPDLSSSILVATSKNKGEIKEVDEILRYAKTLEA